MKLHDVNDYKDLYEKDLTELAELCDDVRSFLIKNAIEKKGHIGSNLGIVELTIDLLKNYNPEKNIILFDTGHQSHIYKMFTKRNIRTIYETKGISNFQEFQESEFDYFSNGHSSTATNYAVGYSYNKNIENIFVIIGDSAFANGLNLSGILNIINNANKKITIILNDNGEAIGKNYFKINDYKKFADGFGLEYLICENGNDISKVNEVIKENEKLKNHTLIHLKTKKMLGYNLEDKIFENHSVDSTNKNMLSEFLDEIILKYFDDNCYLISPATIGLNKLNKLKLKFPNNVIDVGINEDAAILLASSLSMQGKKCFVVTQSSFLQRGYDQLIHDVSRNNLNITFIVDKSGLNYKNGISHHGIFDVDMVSGLKNFRIATPCNYNELDFLVHKSKISKNNYLIKIDNVEINKVATNNYLNEKIIFRKENKFTLVANGNNLIKFKELIESKKYNINLISSLFFNKFDLKIFEEIKNTKLFVYEQSTKNNLFLNIFKLNIFKNIYPINLNTNLVQHGIESEILDEINLNYNKILLDIIGDKLWQ